MKDIPAKLREDKLWQDVYELAEFIYSKIDEITTEHPNEMYATASKLRHTANDGLFYTSQAIGCALQDVNLHDWNSARKNLFSMQAMYIFGAKQNLFKLDPEIVVNIDHLLEEIDKKIILSKKAAKQRDKEELEPWLERYRLWQKMQD